MITVMRGRFSENGPLTWCARPDLPGHGEGCTCAGDISPEFRERAHRFMDENDELLCRLARMPDPCPQCGEADLEPYGGKMRCPRRQCGYLQPCCNP